MEQGRDCVALLALDDRGTQMCANRTRTANTPLILRQVDMALALGCKALILLAVSSGDSDALAAQHLAEANGMRFHLLTRPQQLPALLHDQTDLILFAPGTLANDLATLDKLLGTPALLTIPAEGDDAKELERLDLHTAWGGALRMPGGLTAQIEPLGTDCELLSALPRIARSSGVEERPVLQESIERGLWVMGSNAGPLPFAGQKGGDLIGRAIAPFSRFYAQKNWPPILPIAAALVLAIIAGVTLWFEQPAMAIAVLATAMLAVSLHEAVGEQALPLRLSSGPQPLWSGGVALVPEILAGFAAGWALAQTSGTLSATYGALTVLGASWLSRNATLGGYRGLTSGPAIWFAIAGLGAFGLWWAAIGAATVLAFTAIALELRALRRITRS